LSHCCYFFFFFQAEDGIRDIGVTGVQTCALPVTDMVRTVSGPTAEVVASTFDEPTSEHVHVSDIALEKAKRLVEDGRDVVILLDSITRLARAHNTEAPSGGKLLSGGLDSNAMQKPKRFFGAEIGRAHV